MPPEKIYFVVTDGDVRMIAWGDPNAPLEAAPMVLCPPVIPGDIVDEFCKVLVAKDPEGKFGQLLDAFIDAALKAQNASAEFQGIASDEIIASNELGGDSEVEGPFTV